MSKSDDAMEKGLAAVENGIMNALGQGVPSGASAASAAPGGVMNYGEALAGQRPAGQFANVPALPPVVGASRLGDDDVIQPAPAKAEETTTPEGEEATPTDADIHAMETADLIKYIRDHSDKDSEIQKELDARGLMQSQFTKRMQEIAAKRKELEGLTATGSAPARQQEPDVTTEIPIPDGVDPGVFKSLVSSLENRILGTLKGRLDGLERAEAGRSIQAEESAALAQLREIGLVDKTLTDSYWREAFGNEYRQMAERGEPEVPVDVLVGRLVLQPKHRAAYERGILERARAAEAEAQKKANLIPNPGTRGTAFKGAAPIPAPGSMAEAEDIILNATIQALGK